MNILKFKKHETTQFIFRSIEMKGLHGPCAIQQVSFKKIKLDKLDDDEDDPWNGRIKMDVWVG